MYCRIVGRISKFRNSNQRKKKYYNFYIEIYNFYDNYNSAGDNAENRLSF